jgi:hypothetical protein
MPRAGRDGRGDLAGPRLEGPLGLYQQLGQVPQLVDDGLPALELSALGHDRQGQEQGLEVEGLRRRVVLGEVHQARVGLVGERRAGMAGHRDDPGACRLAVVEGGDALLRGAGQRRDDDERLRPEEGRLADHQLGGLLEVHRQRRSPLQQVGRRLHEDPGAAGAGEHHVPRAALQRPSHCLVDLVGQTDRAGLDPQVALFVEVEHRRPPVARWFSTRP